MNKKLKTIITKAKTRLGVFMVLVSFAASLVITTNPANAGNSAIDPVEPVACSDLGVLQWLSYNVVGGGVGTTLEYGEAKKLTIFGASAGDYESFDPVWTLQYGGHQISEINAVAINPIDDIVYGVARMINGDSWLVRFDMEGDIHFLVPHSGSISGAFDSQGGFIARRPSALSKITEAHALDGYATPASYVAHEGNQDTQDVEIDIGGFEMDGNDLVVVEIDGVEAAVWYDGDGHQRVVVVEGVNTATRTVQSYDVTGQVGGGGAGAMYTFVDGEVYFSLNSGNGFYQFVYDTSTPYVTPILASTEITGYNDGMNCTTEPSPLPCAFDNSLLATDPNCAAPLEEESETPPATTTTQPPVTTTTQPPEEPAFTGGDTPSYTG